MLISGGYSGIFRKFLHRLAFSPPLLLSATWLGLLRLSYLLLLVYLRCEFLEMGGVGLLDCFNQFATQFHFIWLFLLLWLLKAGGNVYRWFRFHLEFHVLFSLLQCFCSTESEAEVRLLSVHFLLFLILRLLCVCAFLPWWYVQFPECEGQMRHISWSSPFWLFLFEFYYPLKCWNSK